ncbi:MAG: outer membrane beta-barrel protein [Muribaculum sp.]|nr:outer membrane beta-barrel protein [Muribaculum sp.]
MLRIAFIFLAFLSIIRVSAITYIGSIVDSQNEPIPFASISVYSTDSICVFNSIANENGIFTIDSIPTNSASISISMMGYETENRPFYPNTNLQSKTFILKERSTTLKEITISAKKNPLKFKDGNFTLDVQNSQLSKQPEIIDVLGFLPGVINLGDNISIIGGGNTLYILNGIEVKSIDRIKHLRPDQIKNVGISTNPSARYGSEYSSIIFINTISRLTDYASAQAEHTSSFSRRYSNSENLSINISKKKWDNYLSYNFVDDKNKNSAQNIYNIYDSKNIFLGQNKSINQENRHGYTHNLIDGLTFRPFERFTFNLQYNLLAFSNKFSTSADEFSSFTDESFLSHQFIDKKSIQHNIDLVGEYLFKNNSKLSISAGYLHNHTSSINEISKKSINSENITGKDSYSSIAVKADYSINLPKGFNLGTGISFSTISNKGNSIYGTSHELFFNDYSNMKDNNTGIYLVANKQFGKLYTSLSIRGEYTTTDYKKDNVSWYNSDYFKIYPNLTLQYSPTTNITLIGSLMSKSLKPSFKDLSPLHKYINSYLLEQGNPLLKQTDIYTSSLALILKNKFVAQARYIRNNNAIIWSFNETENYQNMLINSPSNINYSQWLFNLSYSDAFGIYRFNYEASLKYIPTTVAYLHTTAPIKPQFLLSLVNQFVITPKTLLSINLDLSSKSAYLGVEQSASYGLSFWIKQSFFKDNRLQLILKGNDLLHKSTPKSYVKINNVCSSSIPDFDTRSVSLTIRYVFNGFQNIFNRKNTNIINESRIK